MAVRRSGKNSSIALRADVAAFKQKNSRSRAFCLESVALHHAAAKSVNSNRLLPRGVDARTRDARRFRDLCADLAARLGGAWIQDETARCQIKSAASLMIAAERLSLAVARGEQIPASDLAAATDAANRSLGALGLVHAWEKE